MEEREQNNNDINLIYLHHITNKNDTPKKEKNYHVHNVLLCLEKLEGGLKNENVLYYQ